MFKMFSNLGQSKTREDAFKQFFLGKSSTWKIADIDTFLKGNDF